MNKFNLTFGVKNISTAITHDICNKVSVPCSHKEESNCMQDWIFETGELLAKQVSANTSLSNLVAFLHKYYVGEIAITEDDCDTSLQRRVKTTFIIR